MTIAFGGRVGSEFSSPTPKISKINHAPLTKAMVSAPMLASSINMLNIPRCDGRFPLRDKKGEGPRGVVFGERVIRPPAQLC
jgi:hypothetical protein